MVERPQVTVYTRDYTFTAVCAVIAAILAAGASFAVQSSISGAQRHQPADISAPPTALVAYQLCPVGNGANLIIVAGIAECKPQRILLILGPAPQSVRNLSDYIWYALNAHDRDTHFWGSHNTERMILAIKNSSWIWCTDNFDCYKNNTRVSIYAATAPPTI